MSRKIRLKVSTLIICVCIIVGMIGLPYIFGNRINYTIGRIYDSLGNKDKANTYYKRLLDNNNPNYLAMKAGSKRLENMLDESHFRFFSYTHFSNSMWGSQGIVVSLESLEEINREYEAIKKSVKESDDLGLYEIYVAQMNWFGCDYDRAYEIMNNIEYFKDKSLETYRELNIAAMDILRREYDKADKRLKALEGEEFLERHIKSMGLYLNFLKGNILEITDEDLKVFNTAKIDSIFSTQAIKSLLDFPHEAKYITELIKNKPVVTSSKFTGRVTVNGEGVQGVVVSLNTIGGISTGGILSNVENGLFAITDVQGYYEIINIPNNEYYYIVDVPKNLLYGKTVKFDQICNPSESVHIKNDQTVKLDIQIIDSIRVEAIEQIDNNTIKVQWSPNEMNDKPEITLGYIVEGFDGRNLPRENLYWDCVVDEYGENYALINIEKTKSNYAPMIGGMIGDRKADPEQLFKPFELNGEYVFRVKTGKDDGSYYCGEYEGVIYNEKYKVFKVTDVELSEGDKLLVNQEYEEAISWFENRLKDNPNDIRSLEVLGAINYTGYLFEHDREKKDWKYFGKDEEKAGEYYKRLIKLDERKVYLWRLSDIYKEDNRYAESIKLNKKLVEKYNEFRALRELSDLYIHQMKFKEAYTAIKEYNEKYTGKYKEHRSIMIMSLLSNDIEIIDKLKRQEVFKKYGIEEEVEYLLSMDKSEFDEFFEEVNKDISSAENMIKESEGSFDEFYAALYDLLVYSDEEQFSEKFYKVMDSDLRYVLRELAEEKYYNTFGR